MKLQFDPNQDYQKDAIASVVDLFEGQQTTASHGLFSSTGLGLFQGAQGIGNLLQLDDSALLENLRSIQARNNLELQDEFEGRNFTVEMETGTGKTYVYLRTIFELHEKYGFAKFIIVVPGKAIREGVLKSLEITREHFASLYGNKQYSFFAYSSKRPSDLRAFATSNTLSVMLVNIEAFNTDDRVINRANDTIGGIPLELVQKTNPVVIIDEPQNMESEKARDAIASLNPLCTLRYSATHKHVYNQVFRLGPVEAYDRGLVKRIEVASVKEDGAQNDAYVKVLSVTATKMAITASLEIEQVKDGIIKKKTIKANVHKTRAVADCDLYIESGYLPAYDGFVVSSIDAERGEVEFQNGVVVSKDKGIGELDDEIRKQQIRETITEHLEKIRKFKDKGQQIKVLSLFFIDEVAKYRDHEQGTAGIYAAWFEEAYNELKSQPKYSELALPDAKVVHDGYFSKDKAGAYKDTKGTTDADRDTYALIMKDKERLLSPEEPLQFIFSHSALREGWDNPNVFQICTLNESNAYVKKRQEIGRGLRLPVDYKGQRIFDSGINVLTVIANESYETFARSLQEEIEKETGQVFGEGRVKNARKKRVVRLKKHWEMDERFVELWNRIKHKTRYSVSFNQSDFIKQVGAALNEIVSQAPKIRTDIATLSFDTKKGILTTARMVRTGKKFVQSLPVPDMVRYICNHTRLKPETVLALFDAAGEDIFTKARSNPQHFMDSVVQIVKRTKERMIIDGIKYEKITDSEYEMRIFKDAEIETYIDNMRVVQNQEKTLYDYVVFDSETVENKFAGELEAREEIEFYVKLPPKFKIETPLGSYNPDWAIVFKGDSKLYLVTETKGTNTLDDLSPIEQLKIRAGRAHFASVGEVIYVAPHKDMEGLVKKLA